MNKIRIIIADDQAIVCQGLNAILKLEDDFEVSGICHNGIEVLDMCRELSPDVVLMDARMPLMNGLEATQKIVRLYSNIKVVILTTFNEDTLIIQGIQAGAKAFLLKDVQPDELCRCIRDVHRGSACLHPDVIVKLMDIIASKNTKPTLAKMPGNGLNRLTKRETEVLLLISKGLSNAEIASTLFIVEGTVKNHVSNLLAKLGARDRTQLAILAQKIMT